MNRLTTRSSSTRSSNTTNSSTRSSYYQQQKEKARNDVKRLLNIKDFYVQGRVYSLSPYNSDLHYVAYGVDDFIFNIE